MRPRIDQPRKKQERFSGTGRDSWSRLISAFSSSIVLGNPIGASVAAVILLRSTARRLLALDMLTLILVALLVLYANSERSSHYMDAALVLSLLAFVATLALGRYYGERRIF